MESLGTSPEAPSSGSGFPLVCHFHRYWVYSSKSTVQPKMQSCFQDGACSVSSFILPLLFGPISVNCIYEDLFMVSLFCPIDLSFSTLTCLLQQIVRLDIEQGLFPNFLLQYWVGYSGYYDSSYKLWNQLFNSYKTTC